ncbi:MFS transporter [Marinactinospora thermotolerans]|uniref:Sugar phosphate permease n=1 Tax=Marinactinospora thermotolerans DSM 45154 TaxID=1122192 RepID=A0A1T4T8V9_9ACTN|nr:MFS transporter [Marinactinospora thermotolerans]SKA36866.1 Sugar phosphate permease [Marinactinospora thermotolerans DSM 45154]
MLAANRWFVLCVAISAQIASICALFGVPFVIPELRAAYGLTVAQAGTLAGMPSLGLLLTLLAWGVAIDRYGERVTMTLSLLLTAGVLALLAAVDSPVGVGVLLALVGAASGPVNAASGRLVLGWFAAHERGLAMGIRQAAQPLGMALAAALLPLLAERYGFVTAMLLPAGLSLATAPLAALFATGARQARAPRADPGGEGATGSPYLRSTIWRVHGTSMLLGVPQSALMTYALVYLVDEHGWRAATAGVFISLVQLPGALVRLGAGAWSDRIGNRLGPVRIIAAATGAALLLLAGAAWTSSAAGVVLLALCLLLSMSHNGLTFTAVAETAGLAWAGRAMAVQNSLQSVAATLTPLIAGALIQTWGYAVAFAGTALFCGLAIAVVPPGHPAGGITSARR